MPANDDGLDVLFEKVESGTLTADELKLILDYRDKELQRRHEERKARTDYVWRFAYLVVGIVFGGVGGVTGTTLFKGEQAAERREVMMSIDDVPPPAPMSIGEPALAPVWPSEALETTGATLTPVELGEPVELEPGPGDEP